MTFALLGGFGRGICWWFAVGTKRFEFAISNPGPIESWVRIRDGQPVRVRRGRRWAFVTPTPPEKT
jgi:hypothetical protein